MSQSARDPDLNPGPIRLVVVDDHEIVRQGIKSGLEAEEDMTFVGEASTARDLLQLVEQTRPDVVLLDAQLSGISGPHACAQLTERYPALRVLIVSAYTDDELVTKCVAAGAHGYVVKDIDLLELKQAVRAVHRGDGALSSAVAGKVLEQLRRGRVPTEPPPLTDIQLRILALVGQGYRNREIASRLHLGENTVKSYLQEIFRRLEVRNRAEAAMRASREGWV